MHGGDIITLYHRQTNSFFVYDTTEEKPHFLVLNPNPNPNPN